MRNARCIGNASPEFAQTPYVPSIFCQAPIVQAYCVHAACKVYVLANAHARARSHIYVRASRLARAHVHTNAYIRTHILRTLAHTRTHMAHTHTLRACKEAFPHRKGMDVHERSTCADADVVYAQPARFGQLRHQLLERLCRREPQCLLTAAGEASTKRQVVGTSISISDAVDSSVDTSDSTNRRVRLRRQMET